MLLEIDNFEQFSVFFDVVYDITDLIEFQMFRDHMVCSILDKAHTRFMSVEFKKEFFSVYEVDDAESITLFAEDLEKIIKTSNKTDTVLMQTNEDYLVCKFESNGNSRVFEFVLPPDYIESPHPPSISLPVNVDLTVVDLKQGIKDLKVLGSDKIVFTAKDNLLNITAGVEITSNYTYSIMVDNDDEASYSSMFSLEYIEQLLKFDKISKTGRFSMGENHPLLYSFEDDVMGVKVEGMIAPRLEAD